MVKWSSSTLVLIVVYKGRDEPIEERQHKEKRKEGMTRGRVRWVRVGVAKE